MLQLKSNIARTHLYRKHIMHTHVYSLSFYVYTTEGFNNIVGALIHRELRSAIIHMRVRAHTKYEKGVNDIF